MIWDIVSKLHWGVYVIASAVSFVLSIICLGAVRINPDFVTPAALFGASIMMLWGLAIISSERRKYRRCHTTPPVARQARVFTRKDREAFAKAQSRFR